MIFSKPTDFSGLCDLIPNAFTAEAVDELRGYATEIARREGYPDPIEQAECWIVDAPGLRDAS